MTSIPTVSAAFGCSPLARVRSPQRDRKSQTWNPMTMTSTDIAIGPWLRNMLAIQPMTGISRSSLGGLNGAKNPALSGELRETIVYRYAVRPPAAMLMIVPLMIWSALTEMDSQAWTNDTRTAARTARISARTSAGVNPKKNDGSAGMSGARID